MAVRIDILPSRYTDVEHIARGGMGDVYRATDTVLGRTVAVKLLSERYAGDEDVKRRFKNEALAAARLSAAPSTVTIFHVGETSGQSFIVMEFLEGGSLEQRLRAGRLDTADVLRWLEQTAAALEAGHAAGVIHRDVKPGNLLLDGHGQLHVADFGVASAAGLDSLTMTGMVLGTSGYLSPEQARGERATPASDRYALGVVAWELLAGRRPFESENPTAEAAPTPTRPFRRCPRSSIRCFSGRWRRIPRIDIRLPEASLPICVEHSSRDPTPIQGGLEASSYRRCCCSRLGFSAVAWLSPTSSAARRSPRARSCSERRSRGGRRSRRERP